MRTLVPLFLLAVSVPALQAQARGGPSLARVGPSVARGGPSMARAAVGIRAMSAGIAADPASRSAALPRRSESRQSRALMIAGAAGLVVGSLFDGSTRTIVMLGGAGVGLYGLYKYLE
jgi:hypothetical protein